MQSCRPITFAPSPDIFRSMPQDPYADASIGNVTGSNSVNVQLGRIGGRNAATWCFFCCLFFWHEALKHNSFSSVSATHLFLHLSSHVRPLKNPPPPEPPPCRRSAALVPRSLAPRFLGLGLPWTIGSIYWAAMGRTEEWQTKYSGQARGAAWPSRLVVRFERVCRVGL